MVVWICLVPIRYQIPKGTSAGQALKKYSKCQTTNPKLSQKTRSGDSWIQLVRRIHNSLAQNVSFRDFQLILWYNLIFCFVPLDRVLYRLGNHRVLLATNPSRGSDPSPCTPASTWESRCFTCCESLSGVTPLTPHPCKPTPLPFSPYYPLSFFLFPQKPSVKNVKICLSVYLSVCLSVGLSVYRSACLSICLSVRLSHLSSRVHDLALPHTLVLCFGPCFFYLYFPFFCSFSCSFCHHRCVRFL